MNTKKTFRILAALMLAVCIVFAVSSCAGLGGSTDNCQHVDSDGDDKCDKCKGDYKHTHAIVETAAKAATCLDEGNIKYFTCSVCNKLYSDDKGSAEIALADTVVAASGHKEGDWQTDAQPTCTEKGSKHKACTVCGVTTMTADIFALGHSFEDVGATPPTCYENGYTAHKECSVCHHIKDGEVIPPSHTGEWVSVDANYEQRICTVCERMERREKNTVIDFENGAILDAGKKLSISVGKLTASEGEPSTDAAPGLTEFGNARDKFTLVGDASNKVIRVVSKNNSGYATSTINLALTDPLHTKGTGNDGGKYLVFEFDIKFDNFETCNTGKILFTLKIIENLGSNWISNLVIYNYNGKLRAGPEAFLDDYVPGSEDWITFMTVTELVDGSSGTAVTKLYYKLRDSDGPMKFLISSSRDGSYATVSRTDSHKAQFIIGNNDYDYNYYLDNMSFIRTSDDNYLYCKCAHVMSDWTTVSEAVVCTTDGEITRKCTVDGCGYVENEYIAAHKLTTTPGKAATCSEAGYTASQKCSECDFEIVSTPLSKLSHKLSDWADVEDDKQKRICSHGCGYYELRDNSPLVPITFDDGTVTSGDKLIFSAMATLSNDKKTANVNSDYAIYSVSTDLPDRSGDSALRVDTVISKWVTKKDATVTVPVTNGGTNGNIYTLDFDIYILPGANATNNSSRVVTQILFGGYCFSLGTYGPRVTKYASSLNFGTTKTWISFRFVYNVTGDGEAEFEIFVKSEDGNYVSVYADAQIKGSGIKTSGMDSISFSSYSAGGDFTYYLDNISLTCHESGYDRAE